MIPAPRRSSPSRDFSTFSTAGIAADRSDAATGDDALLDGRAGRVESVLDAGLLLLHLGLGRGADLETATPPESLARRSFSFSLS